MGRVEQEPELRLVNNLGVYSFTVITTERIKRNGGVDIHEELHRVKINENLLQAGAISKGTLVYLQGRLQTHQYYDEQRVKNYKAEIIAYMAEPVDD